MWNRKFGRNADHRKAMLRNLATSVIMYGKVETTEAKAKDMRSVVDELITLGKKGDLAARRHADRNGGYTRVVKTGVRKGDAAPMAYIELV